MACRKTRLLIYLCLGGIILGILYTIRYETPKTTTANFDKSTVVGTKTRAEASPRFSEVLLKNFPVNSTVVLAMVDTSFVDMALNFYLTSLKKYGINSYLFVGATKYACVKLSKYNIPCFVYTDIESGSKPSLYGTADFIRKMNIRTEMILDAMFLGYTVVHTDLDVVFLKNPLPELSNVEGDLLTLWDDIRYNAGFLLVRPSRQGFWIYQRLRQITKDSSSMDDQEALNKAIGECKNHRPPCAVQALPHNYMCGLYYFEHGKRHFAGQNPCQDCTVVHNNWIVSKEAKVYRFKENLMWWYDEDQYYSSKTRLYLAYANPRPGHAGESAFNTETRALKNALLLGHLLNRTVILPRFHCVDNVSELCPLNSLYYIQEFDSEFPQSYRESSFLLHPLVPESVKQSQMKVHIAKPMGLSSRSLLASKPKHSPGISKIHDATVDLNTLLQYDSIHILVVRNMHDTLHELFDSVELEPFRRKLYKALKISNYRQYRDWN